MASFCTVYKIVQRRTIHVPRPKANNILLSSFVTQSHSGRIGSTGDYRNFHVPVNRSMCLKLKSGTPFPNHVYLKLGPQTLCIRWESTTSKTQEEEKSRLQKFRKILHDFFLGAKELYNDVKFTWKIKRKLKMHDCNYEVLSRQELWTMFKTQKNVKKTLPIVFLSFLPFIGYLGPVIGFLRPRQFLSHHFWTEKQRRKFIALDDNERSVYRSAILKDIYDQTRMNEKPKYQVLHKITSKVDQNCDPSNDDLINILPIFSSGSFELEKLSHAHLKNLCSFWFLSSWWPRSLLENKLKKEIALIHKDDLAIAREGVHTLSEHDLEEACHVRGLNTSEMASAELSEWLQDWIQISTNVSETETSFLAHQAIFKTHNSGTTFIESRTKELNIK